MSDVVRLVTSTEPPCAVDAEVVAKLEELLAAAKAGEFNGLAYTTITSPHVGAYIGCGSGWAGAGVLANAHIALGAVSVLHQRMLRELIAWEDGA
jgi:hypothetical protein